jgi:protein tyrosine phosphatase (PTP) superfamily phosphohydrolase (DUF442 family)
MSTSAISGIYNYRPVTAGLATSGQPTEAQIAALAADGVKAIINLALHDDPRYSLRDEAGLVKSLGMEYIHIPIPFDAPAEADLLKFFDAMDRHSHSTLLVHCAANKRVSAFLGLYFAIRKGRPVDEAFALMREVWQPDLVWSSFISDMLGRYGIPPRQGST